MSQLSRAIPFMWVYKGEGMTETKWGELWTYFHSTVIGGLDGFGGLMGVKSRWEGTQDLSKAGVCCFFSTLCGGKKPRSPEQASARKEFELSDGHRFLPEILPEIHASQKPGFGDLLGLGDLDSCPSHPGEKDNKKDASSG